VALPSLSLGKLRQRKFPESTGSGLLSSPLSLFSTEIFGPVLSLLPATTLLFPPLLPLIRKSKYGNRRLSSRRAAGSAVPIPLSSSFPLKRGINIGVAAPWLLPVPRSFSFLSSHPGIEQGKDAVESYPGLPLPMRGGNDWSRRKRANSKSRLSFSLSPSQKGNSGGE